jgi:hypothetical protein
VNPPGGPPIAAADDVPPLTPARMAFGLGLLGGGAALLAWVLPPLSIVLAWPFLFAIPGWWLVSRVAPNLPPPGRVGLAVVTSVFVSAHLVNVVSLVAGFGRVSIFIAVALLAVATAVLATQRLPWLTPPPPLPSREGIREGLRADAPAFAVAAIVGLVIFGILAVNGWHATDRGWVSGGWNWSDLLVHVSIGSSIIHGNFPPQVPYFAGAPLTYHWFADFHGAIAASVAGIDIVGVYFVTSALFAAMLALLVWELARQLTGSRRVATIAAILVCFGGGMGWLRLGADILAGATDIGYLLTQNPYDNSWADGWPWFRIASILGTAFLPHRASTLGMPGMVGVVLLVVTCLGRRPAGVLLAGVLAALLAPFHFYAFPATYLIVLLYVVATRAWRSPTFFRDAVLFLAPIVLAIPFIAGAIFQQGERGAFHFVAIWSEARPAEGPLALVFFYVTNLGIPFLLALAAIAIAAWRRQLTPTILFLAAWLVALFVVPNVVVVSAVEFDMNKYFQMMWIAVAILAAWLIRDWPRPAVVAVVAVAAISPALIGFWHATNPAFVMSHAEEAAGGWIERNTPERSVFVTDAFINSPVDIAGRLRLTTFGPYAANLGYDPAERERDIKTIYCDGDAVAAELMVRHGAGYVLSSASLLECDDDAPTDFRTSPLFETLYDVDGVAVFRLISP